MKILAVKNRRLGDTVLWTSALDALFHFSSEKIHLACPASYSALFESDPRIEKIWPINSNITLSQLTALRREKFDAALFFHASRRSKLIAHCIAARQNFIHLHDRNNPSPFIPNSGIPEKATERDLNVVRALGWSGDSPATKLYVSESTRRLGREKLSKFSGLPDRPILLCPTASRRSKCWPLENYIELIRSLPRNSSAIVVESRTFFAGRERHLATLQTLAPVIETKTLNELIGTLSSASLFIGSDSGAKHIAAALGVPTVTLFGPESIGEWHCYDTKLHRALQVAVGCRNRDPEPEEFAWCNAENCPLSSHACMSLISPTRVYKEVSELLGSELK